MKKNAATSRLKDGKMRATGVSIEVHRWHLKHIMAALAQAKAGHFASDDEVKAAFAKRHK